MLSTTSTNGKYNITKKLYVMYNKQTVCTVQQAQTECTLQKLQNVFTVQQAQTVCTL